jgi:hypothetical protein
VCVCVCVCVCEREREREKERERERILYGFFPLKNSKEVLNHEKDSYNLCLKNNKIIPFDYVFRSKCIKICLDAYEVQQITVLKNQYQGMLFWFTFSSRNYHHF